MKGSESDAEELKKKPDTIYIDGLIAGISTARDMLISRWSGTFDLGFLQKNFDNIRASLTGKSATEIYKQASEFLIEGFSDRCLDSIIEKTAVNEAYFYLVDEHTMEPVSDCEGYPIKIRTQSKNFKKLVPYAQVGIV